MRRTFLLLACTLVASLLWADITVTGVVTSDEDGEPVIGASVLEKGTTNGTITDFDGNYQLKVADKATLVVSYVGMKTQEVKVSGMKHDVKLFSDAIAMDEVVVTAMGVVQEKKRLNFAVQNVGADDLTQNRAANFVNSLQGKIAGVSVTNGSGSPNAGSQIIIRGVSSINTSQSNEPLFIMDGMPLRGGATAAADINPNDIENVTVLKGAAAAALYGQDAANGVIMITTKQAQKGKVSVTANASWQLDTPTGLVATQTSYIPGARGFYTDKANGGWGPLLSPGQKIYNNVENVLTNGFYHKYDFSITGGTDKFQAYASANWSKSDGVVPNDYKQRFGGLVKAAYSPAEWITFNASINVMQSKSRSIGSSLISSAYGWSIVDDITDYELPTGFPRYLYYSDTKKYDSTLSPLYGVYKDGGEATNLRNVLNASVNIHPVKGLELVGRISYDTSASSSDEWQVPRWDDSYVTTSVKMPTAPTEPGGVPTDAELAAYKEALKQYEAALLLYNNYQDYLNGDYKTDPYLTSDDIANMDKSKLGKYSTTMGRSELLTASFMATYKLELPKSFSVDFMVGGELKKTKGLSMSNSGVDFIIPGTYSLSNTNADEVYLTDRTTSHTQKNTFGYYWEVRGDYKGLASLSVTGRWDWSSTLLTSPYFYPSVTAGVVFSELIPGLNNTKNNWFSYGKLRGNYAVVGKDAPLYLFDRRYKQFATFPDNGYGIDPTLSSADKNLAPEMSYSWEIGLDVRFFDNRTRLDLAYYSTKVDNQIVTVRVSPASGYILQTRNEGAIRNHGVEFTLEQDIIRRKDITWTATLNFGLNRGRVDNLPEGVSEITGSQYSDIFTSAYLGGSTTALTGKDYLRTSDGKIIVDADGYPQINPNKNMYIGNREAKFSAGLASTLQIHGVQFSFLFDGRLGGDVVNCVGRSLLSSGQSAVLEKYRGRQVVFDGVVSDGNGGYVQNTQPITLDYSTITNYFYNVSSNFVEDGSYIRLSYVTLGYDFARLMKNQKVLKGLNLSFTANNLFVLTKYTGTDPVCNASVSSGGTGSAGIDNFSIPTTRSFNLALNVKF
ncbi:MAG: SusC/RagA family TonB-linked outer membrane protein [Prevotella sp.]|nr:SusC/RagA family TonB-linked outer membrane protein [Bacteroidales bacterium]MCM1069716.1 SusC/RagA family TonB-linked outer membrane protein [Prevotella sp.]MCM1576768.1 SusC/RagA family TonB-linked outer membrane protein [Bacteroides sp.]